MTQEAAQVNFCTPYFVYQYSDPALRLADGSKLSRPNLRDMTAVNIALGIKVNFNHQARVRVRSAPNPEAGG